MLRVEDVRCRRVVNDDCVLEIASDLREILDIVALVVVAALSEQTVVHDLVDVKLVKQGIAVLGTVSAMSKTKGSMSIDLP